MILRLLGSTWFRAALSVAILAYLATKLDMYEVWRSMVRLDLRYVAVVMVLLAVDRVVMIWRWLLLLRASGEQIATKSAAWIFLVSSFVGSFLPAGVGGDAARAFTLSRRTARTREAVASVAMDRLLGILSIGVLGACGALLWARQIDPDLKRWVTVLGVVILVSFVATLWADRLLRLLLPSAWQQQALLRRVLKLGDAISFYRAHPQVLLAVLALSFGVQLLRILQAYGLGLGLGVQVSFGYYLVFMPIGLLMILLPLSLNGFGLPQGVIVWMLRPVGVPQAEAFALSTLIVLLGVVGNLPGAWLYVRSRKT